MAELARESLMVMLDTSLYERLRIETRMGYRLC